MSGTLENFGKYILLEKIAAGGMAEVYLAKSTGAGGINKFVAIKRILPQYSDNPEFIDMFKEEAKIAVNLNHANVVSIFDFGVQKKQFFLVMEYVEGQNLRQVLNHLKKENRYFSIDQIVYMIKETAAGLDHAHRCLDGTTGKPLNITHRDISPQNIMVSFEGELKIVDFGIAKAESQLDTTRAGTIKGKFGYMSPEQADGQVVDPRTDVFSLGIVLWELLANDRLFASTSEAATLRKIRECQIPSLKKINPAIPPELERIVNKSLAKDKSLRYQSASAFHRDLNRFLNTQYPEFSPQDFSLFMKSCFSKLFMSNRKKLIDFAKIQVTQKVDNQTMTATSTATLNDDNVANEKNPLTHTDLELPETADPIDLSELKRRAPMKQPAFFNQNLDRKKPSNATSSRPIPTDASTKPKSKSQSKSTSTSALVFGIMAVLAVVGYLLLPSDPKNSEISEMPVVENPEPVPTQQTAQIAPPVAQPPPPVEMPVENKDLSSQQPNFAVTIQSTPSGARIYIDGQDTGMITPAQRFLEAGREFTLTLRREGFQFFERRERASENGYVIRATLLPMPKMGYINLDLINGGSNPVVRINGQRIEDKLPLRNYAVVAGTPVKIEVHNPFSGLSAEQTVTVGTNQRAQINLLLTNRKPSQTK